MMRITANGKEVEFNYRKMTFAEGRAMERVTGRNFRELQEEKFVGSLTSLQALVWIVFKRDDPALKFTDLDDWDINAIEFDDDDDAEPEQVPAAEPDPTRAIEPHQNDLISMAPDGVTRP